MLCAPWTRAPLHIHRDLPQPIAHKGSSQAVQKLRGRMLTTSGKQGVHSCPVACGLGVPSPEKATEPRSSVRLWGPSAALQTVQPHDACDSPERCVLTSWSIELVIILSPYAAIHTATSGDKCFEIIFYSEILSRLNFCLKGPQSRKLTIFLAHVI